LDSTTDNTYQELETDEINHPETAGWFYLFPVLLTILLLTGMIQYGNAMVYKKDNQIADSEHDLKSKHKHEINFAALLANEEFSHNIRDTVYTDRDLWLELRIDQQMLYVHYRDGKTKNYPVSSGNKFLDRGIESRPGLFAIFRKEEIHLSSQFENARMNWYMPYNMGIGFHGLPNTGYYGNLGVRPSSHGCIRMRNEDARQLFKECDLGTIVLAHRGETARVVAFAPDGFKNESEYTKEDYMKIMAYNLGAIMEGKYLIDLPKRLIIDGKIIPVSGINVSSVSKIPEKQMLPFAIAEIDIKSDKINSRNLNSNLASNETRGEFLTLLGINDEEEELTENLASISVDAETVKKYAHNPIGILPYFGPKK
jgi:L,D-transpeptidase catalytic domain